MVEQLVDQTKLRVVVVINNRIHTSSSHPFQLSVRAHLEHLGDDPNEYHPNALDSGARKGTRLAAEIGLTDDGAIVRAVVDAYALEHNLLRSLPVRALSGR